VNKNKATIFAYFLGAPKSHCSMVNNIDLDFLSEEVSLAKKLAETSFDALKPAIFLCEGLIMYLGAEGKLKLLRDISEAAAPGSVFVLQFMEDVKNNTPEALRTDEAKATLVDGGWQDLVFSQFVDETLNYGRFPTDRFPPQAGFSFVVCVKSEPNL